MRKFVLGLLVGVILLLPQIASAQAPTTLEYLEVDLWPEYDRPEMLVIYRIRLAEDTELPAALRIRIPAAAGEPSAVAEASATGGLVYAEYTYDVVGDWGYVDVSASSTNLQIEYYDPGLVIDGSQRTFGYTWPGDYAVNELNVQVQQPPEARNVSISPSLGSGSTAGDGLVYYQASLGSLASGEGFDLELSYEKDTDTLTVTQLQPSQPQPTQAQPATGETSDLSDILPWLGVGGGVVLIGFGVYRYWQTANADAAVSKPKRHRRRKPGTSEAPAAGVAAYCHQCGTRAQGGDRFCRNCGAQLKPN